ncbi:MAG TPA: amino acid adenylation domain-containing protein [Noviherbaspirillum sp.]
MMPPLNKKNLHQVVDHLLEQHRGRIAIEHAGKACSYEELDVRSAAIAAWLKTEGVGRGDVVALPMPASIDYVTSLLGVVRAGAIFMPVDPAFPEARLSTMLELAAPRAAIGADVGTVARIAALGGIGILHVLSPEKSASAPRPDVVAADDDTGYLIATSGSTGEPKLIAGRNKGISHFVHWEVGEFGIDGTVRASFFAPPTFDVSLREMFVPLLAGGTLVIPSPEERGDARRLAGWLRDRRVTLVHCVPSLLRLLTRALSEEGGRHGLPDLRLLALAGEPLYGADVAAWRAAAGDTAQMVNLYGPSETTLAKAFHRIGHDIAPNAIVPLGQPISNTALLILRNGRLCDIGEIGELHIHTPFASNGYFRNPALTAAAFIPNPLAPDSAVNVYRTGDLARYLPDRSVEFVGRADRQVKVNGVRIELPEIEAAMRAHADITESAAHTFRLADGENILVGYYTANIPLDARAVRAQMQTTLPDAMLPAYLVQLPEFPRNLNGKIDRRALPRPETMIELGATYVAPADETEAEIAAMWAQALGLEKVGVTSSYLQIGGNSLRAIGLIGRIGQRFGVDITIRDFFECATVRALAGRIAAGRQAERQAIPAAPEQDSYPLTDAQAGLWLLDRIGHARTLYNNVEWLELHGSLQVDALREAFRMLVARHESLRTAYFDVDGEPRQRVLPEGCFALLTESGDAARVREILAQERSRKFDLGSGQLLHAHLVTPPSGPHHLIINMHHIACDGWSMAILVRDLAECYRLACGNPPDAAPAITPARTMRDLAVWQTTQDAGARADEWRARLADADARASIPGDVAPDAAIDPLLAGEVSWHLPAEQTAALRRSLAEAGATPFMAVAAALSVVMYRHGGSETVIIGTPLACRSRPELAGTVGFMVNTLPLVLRLSPNLTFSSLLGRTRQAIETLSESEFDTPAKWAGVGRHAVDPARSPFYDVVLAMEPAPAAMPLDGLQVIEHAVPGAPARNDLSLRVQDDGIALTLILEYRQSLYSHAAAVALLEQTGILLGNGSSRPDTSLRQLPMLTAEQLAALRTIAQGPAQPLPDCTIHEAFDRQAVATPEAVAIVTVDDRPGYRWLQHRANRIAACLLDEYGVQPGDVVAVLLEREPDWPAAILGIMQAGAVYMPLDPWHPTARQRALIEDAGASLLIARGTQDAACPVLDLDTLPGLSDKPSATNVTPDAPAYLIYTSGSTGTPKGVLVSHRAFLNMMTDQIAALGAGADDTVLQFVSPAFDVSLFEVFLALLSGARLGLADRRLCTTPQGFADAVARLKVTIAAMTPGFLNSLGDLPLPGLRMIISGGEAPIAADVARRVAQGIRYINAYGPTEAAVCAAFHEVDPARPLPVPMPIGRPTANTALHVVAPDLTPLPAGAAGELAIAGAGLAIGYFRRPSSTDQAFVTGSMAAGEQRLYRTGDRVRRTPDGALHFLGRADSQVKIRGHRVEPGEVEAAIRRQDGVRDARVVARRIGQDTELAAYWTGDPLAADGLRAALARLLPEYMVPRLLMRLDALPLNANGKLDHDRLPQADTAAAPAYEAPRNPDEQRLAALWSELLGRERVGRDDNFFDFGGRSLAANRLALRASRALGVPVELRDIYAAPTPASLAARVRGRAMATEEAIVALPDDRPAPLSPMQRRLWVIDQLGESGPAYHICGLTRLSGELDVQVLRAAFDDVVARHAVLRTRFILDSGEPFQVTDAPAPLHWIHIFGAQGASLQAQLEEIANRPFHLDTDWPVRVALVQEHQDGRRVWYLLVVLHHIAADGWSMPILESELARAYTARTLGSAPDWTPLPAQYRDVAAWLDHRLNAGACDTDRDYWMQRLHGPLPLLDLPSDRPRPAVRRFHGRTCEHRLDDDTVRALHHCAREQGVTPFTVLLAGLQALLYRLSGQDDLIIGVPVAGRQHPASEGLIGFFVNTLPIRERIDGDKGFAARLAGASEAMRQGMFHQHYPFDRLVGELGVERDTARSPLFDVMIGLDEPAPPPKLLGVVAEAMPLARSGSRCDMTWLFDLGAQAPTVRVEYDTDLFDAARIEDWVRRFTLLLREAVKAPHQPLATLPLLSPEEGSQLLASAAAPSTPKPDVTVLQLFEAHAARHGTRTAIITDRETWTYAELNRAANRLARKLQRHRTRQQAPIALLTGRGPLMAAAQLAVMKCGAAYLPIEPDAPAERIALLLADSGADLLVCEPGKRPAGVDAPATVDLAIPEEEASINLRLPVTPDDPIYVMYTSGSTGRPKGVVALHRGVARLVRDSLYYSPEAGDSLLQLSNYAFDGATFDFHAALANGLTLCIPDQETVLDPLALAAFVVRHGVNVSFITTALFNRVVDEAPEMLAHFRRLYFGGQEASLPHVRRALERMGPDALVHVYGPTECTTFATWHPVTADDLQAQAVRLPIGRPIAHTSCLLLDARQMLVPPGIPGELYIGGAGLAQGYLGQPELTAERFVPSPFHPEERLYRTGDLCVQRADGVIEFLGRLDGQVKVRGFRIELGEVEHHLSTCPGIGKVHVLPRKNADGNTELVAYFTASQAVVLQDLIAHLEKALPRYMLPSHFVLLDAMPLNRNGKVDRQALPPPEDGCLTLDAGPAADCPPVPAGSNEAVLLAVWKSILGRDAIGLHDNYFALGGDSIQAIQIVSRLRAQGYTLKVTDLLRTPTIAQLAPLLVAGAAQKARPVRSDDNIPLTPIQHWLLERKLPALHHFNQSVLLRLPAATDPQRLRRALAALETQHEALRLRFGIGADGQPWQRIAPAGATPDIAVHRYIGSDAKTRMLAEINQIQRSLQPDTGPIWRAALFHLDEGDRLLLTIHHWAVDGVSWRILLEDLATAIEQANRDAITLPTGSCGFADWALALREAACSSRFEAQRDFWQRQMAQETGRLPVLSDAEPTPLGARLSLEWALTPDQTEALFGACHDAYRTRSDELLLAAWVHALTRVQQHPSCRIALESHGRQALAEQIDAGRTVGWFTAIYPLVFTLEGEDWSRHIRQVKETLRAVPDNGIGYGLLRYLRHEPELQGSTGEVVFNYLGRFDHREQPLPVADESTGDELDPALRLEQGLDVSAELRDGVLRIRLVGDCGRHPESCFHALRDAFARSLSELIAHCLSPDAGGLSPSDVDLRGIGIADLDGILDSLEGP